MGQYMDKETKRAEKKHDRQTRIMIEYMDKETKLAEKKHGTIHGQRDQAGGEEA